MDTKVQVSYNGRETRRVHRRENQTDKPVVFSGNRGTKSNDGPRPYRMQYTTQAVSIRICRNSKEKECNQSLSEETVLKRETILGNHFCSRGYFVSTVGIEEEKIKRYVKYQEEQEKQSEKEDKDYNLFER